MDEAAYHKVLDYFYVKLEGQNLRMHVTSLMRLREAVGFSNVFESFLTKFQIQKWMFLNPKKYTPIISLDPPSPRGDLI